MMATPNFSSPLIQSKISDYICIQMTLAYIYNFERQGSFFYDQDYSLNFTNFFCSAFWTSYLLNIHWSKVTVQITDTNAE